MKLSILLLVALAATASAQALCGNNFQDEGERGVDCGTGVDGVATGCSACDCTNDLTRAVAPPTLINTLADDPTVNGDDVLTIGDETGIEGTDLQIVLTVDTLVATAASTTPVNTGATFFNGVSYGGPLLRFIDNNPSLTNDFVNADGTSFPQCDLTPVVTLGTGQLYGTDGNACASTVNKLKFSLDLNTALNTCQFKESISQTQANYADLPAPSGFTSYTTFEGVFKLVTFQYGGLLANNEEVAFELESSFTIVVAIQEQITVTSDAIQVIGAATNQSAITHQIWNTDTSVVDINALIGVSYPAAPSIFGPSSTVSSGGYTGGVSLVELRSETGECGGRTTMIRPNGDCTGTVDQTAVELCVKTAYDEGTQWCDANCDNACSLDDFFEHVTGPDGTAGSSVIDQLTQGSTTADFAQTSSSTDQTLPVTTNKCMGADGQPIPTGGVAGDGDACLSNIHMRLKPRAGWCDLNFDLTLRVGIVCRDDLNGDDTNGDSLIPNGLYNTRTTTAGAAGEFTVDGFTCTTGTLPSKDTFAAGGGGGIDFSIASDNFCPQLVYQATLTGAMSIYESDDWGADCGAVGTTTACSGSPFTMDACQGAATPENGYCRSAPGIYLDSLTSSDTTRKSQNTFVFGQTMYVETRVTAEAGVNIASTTIEQLWIGSQTLLATEVPGAASTGTGATAGDWAQLLRDLGADGVVGGGDDLDTSTATLVKYSDGSTGAIIDSLVSVSDNIVGDDTADFAPDMVYAVNNAPDGTTANRLGNAYEGVSRATIKAQDETIRTTNLQTDATPTRIWAAIGVTYVGATSQVGQSARHVQSATIPAGSANRARLAASSLPIGSGSVGSANVGVRAGSTAGAGGSASTIAGFSSTTVLAAAVVLGAVVAVAAAGFFVARKRSQPTAKTTSSSLELNDAAMTQA